MPMREPEPPIDMSWEPGYGWCASRGTDPTELAAALELVRRRCCAHGPSATTCDCKYGAGRNLLRGRDLNSEQTGCPELRETIHRLLHPVAVDPEEKPRG